MRVWAPRASRVQLVVTDGPNITLTPSDNDPGWFEGRAGIAHGTDYWLSVEGQLVPDPIARWLPNGVHQASRHWDPSRFSWSDKSWTGRSIRDAGCIYELHVGTFTTGGSFDSAIDRLDWLRDLGITHIELMPITAFDGVHGWGYDTVALNAIHEPYGGPDALCRFVDACHARGLAVVLDVVHNHLGPSGNYWGLLGPFLNDDQTTPWGQAVNLDAPGSDAVRQILIDSALGWMRDFHIDGLRLDAVHALVDNRALTFLEELTTAVEGLGSALGRVVETIAESDRNDPQTIAHYSVGGLGMTAQWDDDVHHAIHWLITSEVSGYFADFASAESVRHTLEHGFLHDGTWSSFRGRSHGRPIDFTIIDPWRLIAATQTHDQVGNRATGERLSHLTDTNGLAAAAAIMLSLPYTPMLFMGEEWGAGTPWLFFSSFPDEQLATAVTEGRVREFAHLGWDPDAIPDPQDPTSFTRSVLDWNEHETKQHSTLAEWYRKLIKARRDNPSLGSTRASAGARTAANISVSVESSLDGRPKTLLILRPTVAESPGFATMINLSDEEVEFVLPQKLGQPVAQWPGKSAAKVSGTRVLLKAHAIAVLPMSD